MNKLVSYIKQGVSRVYRLTLYLSGVLRHLAGRFPICDRQAQYRDR